MAAVNLDVAPVVNFSCSVGTIETFSLVDSPDFSAPDPDGPDAYQCIMRMSADATMTVDVAPEDPPEGFITSHRQSYVFSAPTIDGSTGKPVDWTPDSLVSEEWGYIQVLVNDIDVTFYRGVPCQIQSWGSSEPFDDDTISILFPQITSLEALPSWLDDDGPIVLKLVRPDTTKKILWEGFLASDQDDVSENSYGVSVDGHGALYDLDRFLALPPLSPLGPVDIGHAISYHINPVHSPTLRLPKMTGFDTGILTDRSPASWNPVLTSYFADLLSTATADDGKQWTLMKNDGMVADLRKKDTTTVHWTVYTGQPGVTHSLARDRTAAPNAIYGEGIYDSCRWRNAVYPNIRPDDAPVFPGTFYYPDNVYDTNLQMFKQEIIGRGFNVADDITYHASEEDEIRRFQASYEGAVTGIIGPQTWAGAFEPGTDGGSLWGSFFMPVAFDTAVQPKLRQGTGSKDNPNYDSGSIRREHYINFGADISVATGAKSAEDLMDRMYPADYIGSITLAADPQEGHRFEIKAGQNIKLKGHHGTDRVLHISRVEVDHSGGTVTLDVDEAGRDALTLAEIKQRNKNNATPTWRTERTYRNSRAVEDRFTTWDCEVGSGIIPRHALCRNLWNVLRIPCASGGQIIRSEFTLDVPARFSVAVWDRPVTHNWLKSYGGTPLDPGYWDQFGDGLIIAWGGDGQAAGYSPGSESDEDTLTGQLIDDASWNYESTSAPWLWVSIWCESPSVNYCSGRLYPGLF